MSRLTQRGVTFLVMGAVASFVFDLKAAGAVAMTIAIISFLANDFVKDLKGDR